MLGLPALQTAVMGHDTEQYTASDRLGHVKRKIPALERVMVSWGNTVRCRC